MNQPWIYALIGGILLGLIGAAALALANQDMWMPDPAPDAVRPLEA